MRSSLLKNVLALISLFLLSFFSTSAQGDDNIAWLSISGTTKIAKDWTFNFTPIFRYNENFSNMQNYSLDYAFKKKINAHWSFQVLGRTWFLPNGTNRQFLWPQVVYSHKIKDLAWSHRVRWHQAFDIEERVDPDFIRYQQQLKYTAWGKLQPFVALELWWGLNGILQIERLRYIPGVSYKFNDTVSLSAALWRQESLNLSPEMDVNIWRVNLAFNLPNLWRENLISLLAY